jgi:hypothetical protein
MYNNFNRIYIECFQLDETLKSQYELLYVLGVYIKEEKSSKFAFVSSEKITLDKLNEIEQHLYQLMCSLQSAIQAAGNNVANSINKDIIDPFFIRAKTNLLSSIYSVYITMQDSIELMDMLNEFYDSIEQNI